MRLNFSKTKYNSIFKRSKISNFKMKIFNKNNYNKIKNLKNKFQKFNKVRMVKEKNICQKLMF